MFYCGDSLKDSVYYLKEWDAVVVADYVGNDMLLYDIFCAAGLDLGKVLRDAARADGSTKAARWISPKRNTIAP